jgi:hypothetical protein
VLPPDGRGAAVGEQHHWASLNTSLNLFGCLNVTDGGLRALSSLSALSTLNLQSCRNVTAGAKQALRTAIPHLTIQDQR